MAPFNPDIPKSNPDKFLGYSKEIDQPKPDLSLATLFEGVGKTIGSAATGIDNAIKQVMSDNIYQDVNAERQKATDEVGAFRNDIYNRKVADNSNPMNAMAQAMPDEVDEVGNTVSNLQSAQQAGKISLTTYWQAIDNIAKDYRSRYPSYREHIDSTISSITGHNPANAYMSSLVNDINRGLAAGRQDPIMTKALTAAFDFAKNGGTDGDPNKPNPIGYKIIEGLQNGTLTPVGAMKIINEQQSVIYTAKRAKDTLEGREAGIKGTQLNADSAANEYALNQGNADFNTVLIAGNSSTKAVMDYAIQVASNPSMADPKMAQAYALQVQSNLMVTSQKIRTYLTSPLADGQSIAQKAVGMGGNIQQWVDEKVATGTVRQREIHKALVEGNIPLAAIRMQEMQADATNDKYNALKNPNIGFWLRADELLKNNSKDTAELIKTIMSKEYGSPNITKFVRDFHKMVVGQPGSETGNVTAIDEAFKAAKAAGVTDPTVYKDFADLGKNILNPNYSDTAKKNIAAAMFHPKNLGFLSNFNEDQRVQGPDGKDRIVPGKVAVWNTYTSEAMRNEIKRLNDPQITKWYQGWVEQGFGSDIFGAQIRELSQIAVDPRVQVGYNNITNQFFLRGTEGEDFSTRLANSQRRANGGPIVRLQDTIDKINAGIAGLGTAGDAYGKGSKPEDVQKYVLGQLVGLGFKLPDPQTPRDPKTVVDQLFNSFMGTLRQFNPLEGGDKKGARSPTNDRTRVKNDGPRVDNPSKTNVSSEDIVSGTDLNYDVAEPIRSLSEWLKDPANTPPKQLVLDKDTGKYVPYEDKTKVKGKSQDRVGS